MKIEKKILKKLIYTFPCNQISIYCCWKTKKRNVEKVSDKAMLKKSDKAMLKKISDKGMLTKIK